MTSQAPVVPVRTLILTFLLAAAALIGITVVALGQLQRPRPPIPRSLPVPIVVPATPTPPASSPPSPGDAIGRTTVAVRRKHDKPAVPRPIVDTSQCRPNDPLCGLPID